MSDALSITEISMNNDLLKMKVISNNLANSNTIGFKRDLIQTENFQQVLNANISAPVPLASVVTDFSSGTLNTTNNPLDLAIEGDNTFFEVSTDRGVYYTRQGNFALDQFGRLTTNHGFLVNGEGGDIRLSSYNPKIDKNGDIFEGTSLVGTLKLVDIYDLENLSKLGKGLYEYSGNSLAARISDSTVRQGFLETQNVNLPGEMLDMVELVKHFKSSQKVIQGYDDMLSEAMSVLGEF